MQKEKFSKTINKRNCYGTKFQLAVWTEIAEITPGATKTYTELANLLGNPKSARAVANACGKNPYVPEIPCHRVAENDDFLAFLDISPNSIGHTLCIPKVEIDDILDLDEVTYKNLMLFSRKVAKSIKKVIKCKKVAMSVIGLEVPHVHVHLIPINQMKDADFSEKIDITKSDFTLTAKLISDSFNSL